MFRYPTRPMYDLQDELDRLWEQWPANDRPVFPPSPAPCQENAGEPAMPVSRQAPSAPLLYALGAAGALTTTSQD